MTTNQTLVDPQLDGLRGSEAGDALLNDLRKAIETGQLAHGHKIAPLRNLAKRYNISVTTARAAIMQLAALNLVDARQGSGTYVTFQTATPVRPAQATGIELVTVKDAHVIERLASEVISGLQDRGRAVITVGWRTQVGVEQLDQVLARWRANPPEAIVLQVGWDNLDEKIDAACGGRSKIITVFRNHFRPKPTDSVEPDRLEGYRLATATLIEQGHKRIGLVMAPRAISAHQPWTLRKRTMWNTEYILTAGKVVRAAGKPHTISVHYEQLFKGVVDPWRDPNLDKIEQWFKRSDRPTAIVGDDFRVAPAVRVAERMGLKLGRDLAVIGIGNTPWADAFGFSSVSYREDVMARHVVEMLCDDAAPAGGSQAAESVQHIMVLPKLVIR